MVLTSILPAAYTTRKSLAESIVNLKTVGVPFESEKSVVKNIGDLVATLQELAENITKGIDLVNATHDDSDIVAADVLVPLLSQVRLVCDKLEQILPDSVWPFPKLTELLFAI